MWGKTLRIIFDGPVHWRVSSGVEVKTQALPQTSPMDLVLAKCADQTKSSHYGL